MLGQHILGPLLRFHFGTVEAAIDDVLLADFIAGIFTRTPQRDDDTLPPVAYLRIEGGDAGFVQCAALLAGITAQKDEVDVGPEHVLKPKA